MVGSSKIIGIINQILLTKKFRSVNQKFVCPYSNHILWLNQPNIFLRVADLQYWTFWRRYSRLRNISSERNRRAIPITDYSNDILRIICRECSLSNPARESWKATTLSGLPGVVDGDAWRERRPMLVRSWWAVCGGVSVWYHAEDPTRRVIVYVRRQAVGDYPNGRYWHDGLVASWY